MHTETVSPSLERVASDQFAGESLCLKIVILDVGMSQTGQHKGIPDYASRPAPLWKQFAKNRKIESNNIMPNHNVCQTDGTKRLIDLIGSNSNDRLLSFALPSDADNTIHRV